MLRLGIDLQRGRWSIYGQALVTVSARLALSVSSTLRAIPLPLGPFAHESDHCFCEQRHALLGYPVTARSHHNACDGSAISLIISAMTDPRPVGSPPTANVGVGSFPRSDSVASKERPFSSNAR